MAAKVGVVLSGCGVNDGTEITEAVSILIALDRRGAQIQCMAPNIQQMHVINHLAGKPALEHRNVMVESARIARGKIEDLSHVKAADIDALVFPGGFGAAKNLSDFATKHGDASVNHDVARLCIEMHAAGKPIGFACIAPVIAARLFGDTVTIGNDAETAAAIEKMGAKHQAAGPTEICIDEKNRIVTTPCYMYDSSPWQVFQGADKMVDAVLKFLKTSK